MNTNNLPAIKENFEFKNELNSSRATLYLYGTIRQSYYGEEEDITINAKRVINVLQELNGKPLDIHINSNGGDAFESITIGNQLKAYSGDVDIYIDGIAGSGASIIVRGADNVFMYKNSMQMIHRAWTYTDGNSEKLRKVADDLEKLDNAVMASYKADFVGTDEELEELVKSETFLTADECLAFGLCTKIIDDAQPTIPKPQADIKETLFNKYKKDFQNEFKPPISNPAGNGLFKNFNNKGEMK
ncbi:MAG: Clp protease ClpP [Oscillospiraceae bacterium]